MELLSIATRTQLSKCCDERQSQRPFSLHPKTLAAVRWRKVGYGTWQANPTKPTALEPVGATHPLAVKVMAEVGIDISQQHPKGLKEYLGKLPVCQMIVVCDVANESCPRIWPGVLHRHYWPFCDPAQLSGEPDAMMQQADEYNDGG